MFKVSLSFLIISVLCVCFIGIFNLENPKIALIDFLSDTDISDVSSKIGVINLETLKVFSLEVSSLVILVELRFFF